MFDQVIVELMKTDQRPNNHDDDCVDGYAKPVQFKPSLADRGLTAIGDAMINLGLKLKNRPNAALTAERAQAPNFLIML